MTKLATEPANAHRSVHQPEHLPAVEPFDDRPDQVQRVHVEEQVEEAAVDERDGEQAPVLARRDRRLVEPERLLDPLAVVRSRRVSDTITVRPMISVGQRDRQPRPAATPGEVAARAPLVAGLLGQPAEARRDLGLVLGRSPLARLRGRPLPRRSGCRRGRGPRRSGEARDTCSASRRHRAPVATRRAPRPSRSSRYRTLPTPSVAAAVIAGSSNPITRW